MNFVDIPQAIAFAERLRPDGVLTITSDRAVVAVAAVAEALGLPGIGVDVAVGLTNKVEMRRRLDAAGNSPAALRLRAHARGGADGSDAHRLPARDQARRLGRAARRLPARVAWTTSTTRSRNRSQLSRDGEVILEEFVEGIEMNAMAVVRDGEVTHADALRPARPPGTGFAVGWIHAYPAALDEDATARAEELVERTLLGLGLRNGIGFPQLIAHGRTGGSLMIEVAARIPGGQMADLVRHAVGVDLVEVALRFALGEPMSDELVRAEDPHAGRDPLLHRAAGAAAGRAVPASRVARQRAHRAGRRAGRRATSCPARRSGRCSVDGDRRGYVIAVGATGPEALERAERAAALVEVEVE